MINFNNKQCSTRNKNVEKKPRIYNHTVHSDVLNSNTYDLLKTFNYSGVYQIKSKSLDSILYIGASKNICIRIHGHITTILYNHKCVHGLKEHCDLYGINDLEFSVLEETNDLFKREYYYMDTLKPIFNLQYYSSKYKVHSELINTIAKNTNIIR